MANEGGGGLKSWKFCERNKWMPPYFVFRMFQRKICLDGVPHICGHIEHDYDYYNQYYYDPDTERSTKCYKYNWANDSRAVIGGYDYAIKFKCSYERYIVIKARVI